MTDHDDQAANDWIRAAGRRPPPDPDPAGAAASLHPAGYPTLGTSPDPAPDLDTWLRRYTRQAGY